MTQLPSLRPSRRRRALTLAEVMIAVSIGGVLSLIAFGLVAQTRRATARLDLRLAFIEDADSGLAALEREIDRMVPDGWPAVDMARESFGTTRVRFHSSREFGPPRVEGAAGQRQIVLVELRLEAADGDRHRRGAPGTADDVAADRLVLEYLGERGEPTGRVVTLHRFRGEAAAALRFDSDPPADGRPVGAPSAARPALLRAVLEMTPLGEEGPPSPLVVDGLFRLDRTGGGA